MTAWLGSVQGGHSLSDFVGTVTACPCHTGSEPSYASVGRSAPSALSPSHPPLRVVKLVEPAIYVQCRQAHMITGNYRYANVCLRMFIQGLDQSSLSLSQFVHFEKMKNKINFQF